MDALCGAIDGAGFPGEHSAAIIRALLTGRRDALPQETVEAFRRSGASHILALSGMHLGVIYLLIRRLLWPLGNSLPVKVLRCAVCIGACAFYTISTGAGPSITRAFLFILIRECGSLMPGRRLSGAGTLGLALMVQLAVHPGVIASAGFQLSYLAMMGITLLYPRLRAWYPGRGRMDPLRRIWEAAALSISCQLFTAPAAWWHFRSLPGHFLLTNIIALPLTEFIIVTALCGLLLGALGINARPLVYAGGKAAEMLEFCLEAISSM